MTDFCFKDLEDLNEWEKPASSADIDPTETKADAVSKKMFGASDSKATVAKYEEKCTANGCHNGTFFSWAGRSVGPCFKCKGTGIRKFKTSPESRAKARERAVKRKAQIAADKAASAENYREEHAELFAYLEEVSGWNGFAAKMIAAVEQYGSLTVNQKAAVDKMHSKYLVKQAEKARAPSSGVDLTDIPAGLYAVPNGETRLKIAIRKPGKRSKWHGSIFVDDGAEYGNRRNYGRQMPGKEYEGKIVEQLKAIAADPLEAMKAYGRLVGQCGACGRKLEDETSIEMGIGPVCAKKF
jgi:hypothetical protein